MLNIQKADTFLYQLFDNKINILLIDENYYYELIKSGKMIKKIVEYNQKNFTMLIIIITNDNETLLYQNLKHKSICLARFEMDKLLREINFALLDSFYLCYWTNFFRGERRKIFVGSRPSL